MLPACQDNILLAEKWKREQIKISGFLDNHTGRENHNIKLVLENGYKVENLKEKLEGNSTAHDIYVVCHWRRIIDVISKQLSESGIKKDSIIEIDW